MSILGKVEKVGHAIDTAFEALHPRARKGSEHGGEFVDVVGRMEAAGGTFDQDLGVWHLPVENRPQVDALLDEINYEAVPLPPNFRAAVVEDRQRVYWPPAWSSVFVSQDEDNDLQAIGYDAGGERQYVYHADHTERQSLNKYARVAQLSDKLDDIDRHLSEAVLEDDTAAALMLMRKLAIRPGGGPQKGKEPTYGATTLLREHVTVTGDKVRLRFVGKHGKKQDLTLEDAELAAAMKARMKGKSTGEELFPGTHPRKLRDRMKEIAPGHIPYDFRTHFGTSEGLRLVEAMPLPTTQAEHQRYMNEVGERVAEKLGNTREIALASYIDPRVFDAWPAKDSLPKGDQVAEVNREAKRKASAIAKKAVKNRSAESMSASAKKAAATREAKKAQRAAREEERKAARVVTDTPAPTVTQLDRRAEGYNRRLTPRESGALATYLEDGPSIDNALRYSEARPSARRVPDIDEAFKRADKLEEPIQARRFVDPEELFGEADPFALVGEQFTDPRYVMATTRTDLHPPQGLVEMVLKVPAGTRPIPMKGGALMLPHGSNFRIVGADYGEVHAPRAPKTDSEAAAVLDALTSDRDLGKVEDAIQNLNDRGISEDATDDWWLKVYSELQRGGWNPPQAARRPRLIVEMG